MDFIKQNFKQAQEILQQYISEEKNFQLIQTAGEIMVQAIQTGHKIIACGNGGSMCDAIHFAEELSGRFREERLALPAVAISDAGHITCTANDYGFDHIFSRYIEGLGREGDVLLAISTSGNSANIIRAGAAAHKKGMKIIALTGKNGGKLAGMATVELRAPYSTYSDRTQEIHIKIIHALIEYIERNINK